MKKIFILLALACAVTFFNQLNAQDSKPGIRVGLNFSNITGDDASDDLKSKTGFYAGFYYDYAYNDLFGTEAGLFYSEMGAKSSNDTSALNLTYLELPFVFKYYPIRQISIEAGVQYSFLAAATDGTGEAIEDYFRPDDFSMLFGGGYKFDFGLVLGLRYRMSLISIAEFEAPTTIGLNQSDLDLKNSATQLSLGFLF